MGICWVCISLETSFKTLHCGRHDVSSGWDQPVTVQLSFFLISVIREVVLIQFHSTPSSSTSFCYRTFEFEACEHTPRWAAGNRLVKQAKYSSRWASVPTCHPVPAFGESGWIVVTLSAPVLRLEICSLFQDAIWRQCKQQWREI